VNSLASVQKPLKLNKEMENKRKTIVRSFSLAKDLYNHGHGMNPAKESELQAGAEFLEVMHNYNFSFVCYFILVCLTMKHEYNGGH
jgi:hypothetical protein